jgi:hypothetical protein
LIKLRPPANRARLFIGDRSVRTASFDAVVTDVGIGTVLL